MEEDQLTVSREFTIRNKLGLHARAASLFVQVAGKYESDIFVSHGEREINGKSIMGILILAASQGSKVTVKAVGSDAEVAVRALGELIEDGFGED